MAKEEKSKVLRVKFNYIADFIGEMKRDGDEGKSPSDGIVRITRMVVTDRTVLILKTVYLLVTYLNRHDQIVELRTYCGQIMDGETGTEVNVRVAELQGTIEQWIGQHNFASVRGGELTD